MHYAHLGYKIHSNHSNLLAKQIKYEPEKILQLGHLSTVKLWSTTSVLLKQKSDSRLTPFHR